jgi:glycosyltransferase involved in cell wall biosynthesis
VIKAKLATVAAPDPLRVLHAVAGNLYGGIETFLVTLARQRALCPEMDSSFALCFEGRLAEELRAAGGSVHSLGPARISRPWTVWRVRRRFDELLRRTHPDVIVTHGCWPHGMVGPVVRRHGQPLVFLAHNFQDGRHWLEWWAARTRADRVIANSEATRRTVAANLFPRVGADVVYLPVSPADSTSMVRRRAIRETLGASDDTVVIVIASRLEAYKGHALLMDALGLLPDRLNWYCWVAGGVQRPAEMAYLAHLQTTAMRLGIGERVHFLGQRSDVRDLLAAADIHCQPNIGAEPFGIAFVEALYASLPVVTTGLGGALEIIDETCGVLLAAADAPALAAALGRLIGDASARRQLGAGGLARATQLCDPARQMQKIASALRTAVTHCKQIPSGASSAGHAANLQVAQ